MKRLFLLLLLIFISNDNAAFAQQKPSIFGVVMGISKYQNVPSLRFADRDAMSFYNFLLSPAGGGADTNNIRLLLNEKATSYNFFEAMDNLLDMAREGDQVYIYFAGHGDIEKKTERQNGFLIGYNAPSNCYAAGGCISVRFLQDYVETLISKNKSKVTLIIDACRSGKLAGGAEGAEVTALALKAEWKGVTKILSCQPGETSLEGEKWGGGAGVFSYFMLKGLLGQADRDGDGIVSVMELNNFLDENVLRETNKKQLPEIVGDRRQDIVKVDKKHALAMLNQMEKPITLPPEKQSAGFEADISSITNISVLKEYVKFKEYINNNNLISYNDTNNNKETALSVYRSLEGNREANPIVTMMKRELLAALQNKAQVIMNGWLDGLNPVGTFYDSYKEIKTAYSLCDSSSTQYNQVKYKYIFWNSIEEKDTLKQIELLEECIRINPGEPYAHLNLGERYRYFAKYDKALYHFDKALELSKKWVWAWNNKANTFKDLGQFQEALKCYNKALELKPDNVMSLINKGNLLVDLNKVDEGITCFDNAIELGTTNIFNAWTSKGLALLKKNKKEEAIKCYDKAIEIKPDYINAWDNKGVALSNLGRNEEALKCFDKAIEINPDYSSAWFKKGMALSIIGRYSDAIACFDKSILQQPAYHLVWFEKGLALAYLGQYEESIKCYEKTLELKSDNALAWHNKGTNLGRLEQYEESIKCFDRAIEIDPKLPHNWKNKGRALFKLGQYEESIRFYNKAIELEPENGYTWKDKGLTLIKLGKYEDAIKCFDKALELKPGDPLIYYDQACGYSIAKNKDQMLKFLKKAIELDKKYKADAPRDNDFKEYWNDPDFMELVK